MRSFNQRLADRCDVKGHVCVGLDPDPDKYLALTQGMGWRPGIADYCRFVVEATSNVAAAFKLNSAFFEQFGADGLRELKKTIEFVRSQSPDIIIILDAKRGDIGVSSQAYAQAAFESLEVDAITVNPYMGTDSVEPFLSRHSHGAFVLCRTSNEGSSTFQRYGPVNEPLFLRIAAEAANEWNENDNCGLVVGATYPDELPAVVAQAPDLPLLVPGVGTQGGDLQRTVSALTNSRAFIVNSSRSIMYPKGQTFGTRALLADAVHQAAEGLSRAITDAKLSDH